ncbi:MAG: hypothetical protein ABSE91_03945 [Patescibacteria group bacterium]|jgi:hypothetical protein
MTEVTIWRELLLKKKGGPVEMVVEQDTFDCRWLKVAVERVIQRPIDNDPPLCKGMPSDVCPALREVLARAAEKRDVYELRIKDLLRALHFYPAVRDLNPDDRKVYLKMLILLGQAAANIADESGVRFFVGMSREEPA